MKLTGVVTNVLPQGQLTEPGRYVGGPDAAAKWERAYVQCPLCMGRLLRVTKASPWQPRGRVLRVIGEPQKDGRQQAIYDPVPKRTHRFLLCGRCHAPFTATHARLKAYYVDRQRRGLPVPMQTKDGTHD